MVMALDTHWIWDSWYLRDGDTWHGYFLKAPKSIGDPELRHFNVEIGHATSTDLKTWTHLGTCLAPSTETAWDDYTTWTGSTVRDDAGKWHLFYTGARQDEDARYQRIGHATSSDGHIFERVDGGLCLEITTAAADQYEHDVNTGLWHERAMRDPWVMRDPNGDGWLMYFTARASGIPEPNGGGAIGHATSPDLMTWTLQPPVFTGGYGQLEVPQVLELNGRWYCLFCTLAEHFSAEQAQTIPGGPVSGTHYLVGDSPQGPWHIAEGPFLDGSMPCKRYCARICETENGPVILGFADRPEGDFIGQITDPDLLVVENNGKLRVQTRDMAGE